MPPSVQADFQGTAASFRNSLSNEPLLILAALVTVYIVLGVLYESFIHPITILSTLPSAGVGAFLALLLFHQDLSIVAIIGIVLLIGIVKKNGIMMVDFALEAEREQGKEECDRGDLRCVPAPFPAHPDDDDGRASSAGIPLAFGSGHRVRVTPPAWKVSPSSAALSLARCSRSTPRPSSISSSTTSRHRFSRRGRRASATGGEPQPAGHP